MNPNLQFILADYVLAELDEYGGNPEPYPIDKKIDDALKLWELERTTANVILVFCKFLELGQITLDNPYLAEALEGLMTIGGPENA